MLKRLLLATLAAVYLVASADDTPDTIYASCTEQMARGTCAALRDPGQYTPEQLAKPMAIAGAQGIVLFGDYLAIRGTGDVRMCTAARDACTASPSGGKCAVSRALWGH